jgi:hypothetical protein
VRIHDLTELLHDKVKARYEMFVGQLLAQRPELEPEYKERVST